MSLGGTGRSWFVAGAVAAVAVAFGAGLAQPWASESGSARVPSGRASSAGVAATEVVETGIALEYHVAGVVEWQDELVALTSGGEVVRSGDGRAWETIPASGFASRDRARGEGGEGDACAGDTVRGVAARNGLLVAVGARAVPPEPGDDYCDARLKLWRSGDATTWEPVEPSGLAETDSLDTVVADTSGFLAFGYSRVSPATDEDDEEQGRGLTVWRSSDGVTWEPVPTEGLSKPTAYKYQFVNSVAVRDDRMLAAIGTECVGCYDDDVVALWRSDGPSAWQELRFSGLDELDQANSDIVPAVAATNQGYVAFASVGKDHGDDRTPAVWSSTDGERWEQAALVGPSPSDGSMDAAASTRHGAFALDSTLRGLVVWRVESR
jgi:hypothetical protein